MAPAGPLAICTMSSPTVMPSLSDDTYVPSAGSTTVISTLMSAETSSAVVRALAAGAVPPERTEIVMDALPARLCGTRMMTAHHFMEPSGQVVMPHIVAGHVTPPRVLNWGKLPAGTSPCLNPWPKNGEMKLVATVAPDRLTSDSVASCRSGAGASSSGAVVFAAVWPMPYSPDGERRSA